MGLIIIPVLSTSLDCPDDRRGQNVNFKVLYSCEVTAILRAMVLLVAAAAATLSLVGRQGGEDD